MNAEQINTKLQQLRSLIIRNKSDESSIQEASQIIDKLKHPNQLNQNFDSEDKNPLLMALSFNNKQIANLLIKTSLNLEITDQNQMNALMWATYFNLHEIVLELVNRKVLLNKQTIIYQWSALMHGAYTNAIESVKILLNAGIDKSLKDNEGKTALDIALRENHQEIIYLLQR